MKNSIGKDNHIPNRPIRNIRRINLGASGCMGAPPSAMVIQPAIFFSDRERTIENTNKTVPIPPPTPMHSVRLLVPGLERNPSTSHPMADTRIVATSARTQPLLNMRSDTSNRAAVTSQSASHVPNHFHSRLESPIFVASVFARIMKYRNPASQVSPADIASQGVSFETISG